jgi:plastocyanin
MRVARFLPPVNAALLAMFAVAGHSAQPAAGAALTTHVIDRDGQPVPRVAIYAVPAAPMQLEPIGGATMRAVMDQKHRAFVPHILVVTRGTEVTFPNSDEVSHHVYSFSPAKTFELPLYKQGTVQAPLRFDEAGVVTLGCNIHDNMVGYILVVATPYFALTDATGTATLAGLPPGDYSLHVWTPRMRASALPEPTPLRLEAGDAQTLTAHFTTKLYPPHDDGDTTLKWSNY